MILYVVRHAKAIESSKAIPDEWRCLTEEGRSAAKIMGSKLADQDIQPHLIISSPLVRAVQTAELFAEKVKRSNLVIISGNLLPDADINQLIAYLKEFKESKCIMLVGHEPLLSSFVAELLSQPDKNISLKKGACIALDIQFDKKIKTKFLWYLMPGKKPIDSLDKAFL